jgi:hypothetical protein
MGARLQEGRIKAGKVRLGWGIVSIGFSLRSGKVRPSRAMCAPISSFCFRCLFRTLPEPAMSRDEDFQVRPGRIRSPRAQWAKPFISTP